MLLRMSIDVRVTGGGTITSGTLHTDSSIVARCSLCAADVDATAAIGAAGAACGACLRARLDALSVARFRLQDSGTRSTPWGKVTG